MTELAVSEEPMYRMRDNVQSRWISFENPSGSPGAGARANQGAKGAAFQSIQAGEEKILMDFEGGGIIHRMWCTLSQREPKDLRSYVLRMYWDNAEKPAVEVPLGDFFGAILGEVRPFEGALFSSPEGRSFNFTVDMPFRARARVTLKNESETELNQFFYDINYSSMTHEENTLYFHAAWHRERYTELKKDFEILPKITGAGRFLGAHIGVIGHPGNLGWWGEGEVKMYLDGDTELPTLVGTGTEDYVGTGYLQGEFSHRYQGSLLIDNVNQYFTFYRYHIPDPIYFHQDIRVTIQQIGGAMQEFVKEMLANGVEILPISVGAKDKYVNLLEGDPPKTLDDPDIPYGWTNYYRRDDICATAFFYLNHPENNLPPIAPVSERIIAVGERRSVQ
jgi:hypothetical protein